MTFIEMFSRVKCSMKIRLSRYEDSHLMDQLVVPWDDATGQANEVAFGDAKWRCHIQADEVPGHQDAIDLVARFEVAEGVVSQASVGLLG